QYYGNNYLVPVGAQLQDEGSVRFELIALDEIKGALDRRGGVKILVPDAGTVRNSPLTRPLLDNLPQPGLEIGAMFRKVATRVYEVTRGKQVPELSISLLSDVFLNRNETDAQIWGRVRAANDPAGVRDFLDRFPNSFYAADARMRLDMLERATEGEQRDCA